MPGRWELTQFALLHASLLIQTVTVHYVGTLTNGQWQSAGNDHGRRERRTGIALTLHACFVFCLSAGTKFDSSRDKNRPFQFKLGECTGSIPCILLSIIASCLCD